MDYAAGSDALPCTVVRAEHSFPARSDTPDNGRAESLPRNSNPAKAHCLASSQASPLRADPALPVWRMGAIIERGVLQVVAIVLK
jgi:hypothetical protein